MSGIGAVFVFRYGVLVLIGASAELESELIAELRDHEVVNADVDAPHDDADRVEDRIVGKAGQNDGPVSVVSSMSARLPFR